MSWDVEQGEYDARDGWLRLWCDTDERWYSRRSLRIVPWGERTYLVDEWGGERFCDEVNLGSEPRGGGLLPLGGAYLCDGDERLPVDGLPEVPPEWRPYLLDPPREGRVAELHEDGTAVIDLGRKDGLRERMPLVVWCGESPFPLQVSVVSLTEDDAVITDLDRGKLRSIPKPAPGDRVTTRLFEHDGFFKGDAR